MSEKTIVAVSATIESDYSFLLPFSCLLWREFVGFEPRVFLAGTDWSSHHATMCISALAYFKITPTVVDVAGYRPGTIAKHIRQHAACDPKISGDTWIMPTDADLWPLKHDFYHQHESAGAETKAVLYNAFGDRWRSRDETLALFLKGVRFPTIPMCHTVMRAKEWRRAWNLTEGDFRGSLAWTFKEHGVADASQVPAGETQAGWDWWVNSDQRVLTYRLCLQDWFPEDASEPGAVRFIAREGGPPRDRMDRAFPAVWPRSTQTAASIQSRWTDAHLHKMPEAPNHWQTLLPLVDALLPHHSAWARDYWEMYTQQS